MDLRVKKTYTALVNAFVELMEECTFEEMTVATLCDRAMIRRTTFYKHFADKNDFFVFAVQELWDMFRRAAEQKCVSSRPNYGVALVRQIIDFLNSHEKIVDNLMRSNAYPTLLSTMSDLVAKSVVKNYMEAQNSGMQLVSDPQTVASFALGGTFEVLRHWWQNGRVGDPTQSLLNIFAALMHGDDGGLRPVESVAP